jgi:hypothetical protein
MVLRAGAARVSVGETEAGTGDAEEARKGEEGCEMVCDIASG